MVNKTLTEIANYIERHSLFTMDDWEENKYVLFSCREHGHMGTEEIREHAGEQDIAAAKELIKAIQGSKEWGPLVQCEMDTCDEWTMITVTLKEPCQ